MNSVDHCLHPLFALPPRIGTEVQNHTLGRDNLERISRDSCCMHPRALRKLNSDDLLCAPSFCRESAQQLVLVQFEEERAPCRLCAVPHLLTGELVLDLYATGAKNALHHVEIRKYKICPMSRPFPPPRAKIDAAMW